jgi:hypothetical protein
MSERAEVKRDGSVPQSNSGRGKHAKGDAILGPFCYDIKEYAQGFTVNRAVWGKVCTDAFRAGNLEPALKLVLGEGNSRVRLWVISDEMMKELLENYDV